MNVITIQQTDSTPDGFRASVSFDRQGAYEATITPPLNEEQEETLEWYFEEHLRFPFTDQVRARDAAESITRYGEALFEQVFADPEARAEYIAARAQGVHNIQFEISGAPEFHRLHWEALKDPNQSRAFALDGVMVRKNDHPQPVKARVQAGPTINLLIVVARPSGPRDVGYRTISRPLVENLRQAGIPVQIDIVRPGSYEALDKHLQATTATHGAGYYHVIHFDMHGALLSFNEVQQGVAASRYIFGSRYGRDDIQPYQGLRAFLFMEGDDTHPSDPVAAQELADLLSTHQIPIAVLNACQSGKQVGADETSLGSRLMQAGVQLVVAMGYSVTVSAAEIMMRELYQQLFNRADLATALRLARRSLFNRKQRRAYFNQTIELEDWLLPVVYQNQPIQLAPRPFTPEEAQRFYGRQARRFPFPEPSYGFWGRDLDILEIERRLLQPRNLLLVRGMGGAGKTTLLRHLGAWWQTTGLVELVFEFAYDQHAWSRQQILHEIARRLLGEVEYLTLFQPLPLDAQQALITQRLRATRHLVILDNLESITGAHLAIQHMLPPDEQQALRRLLADLRGGRTLVLLGSRGGETWLQPGTFDDNLYDLPGLDDEAATALADAILLRNNAMQYRPQPEMAALLKLLGGYPLPMEVVLANLRQQTPADVLAALQAGDVRIDPKADSQEKTASILRCIDYAHGNLSPDAQALLVCLAPFTGVLFTPALDAYTEQLKQQPMLAQLPFERWQEMLGEAANWGLLSSHPQVNGFLQLQPVLPYFFRSRLNDPSQADVRRAIETAFHQLYDQLGKEMVRLLQSKEPQQRQVGQVVTSLEYENLVSALNLALKAQVSIINPYLALSLYLDAMNDQGRGLELGEIILALLASYPAESLKGPLGAEFIGVIDNIAKRQLLLKQFEKAGMSYRRALDLHLGLTIFEDKQKALLTAGILHQLGTVAQEQRQWSQAEQYYQQALQICVEFNDRYEQANTYHNLGTVAQEQRQWSQAEQYYQQALQIFIAFNDRYEQANTYHQLGMVAQQQRQWLQAEQYYQQALQTFIAFNDRYRQAYTYHQLGTVAQEQRQWQQAEQYYQQALQIFIAFNDRYSQAKTLHVLGSVAQEQRELEQAEQYYQQALQLYIEFSDRFWEAGAYHQLGMVAQEQRQWPQAEHYYQQALQLKIEFKDHYSQASTYHQLGRVAQEQRQWQQAREYLLKALAIFVEYKDEHYISGTVNNLARLWRESGDATLPAATAQVLGWTVEEMESWLQKWLEAQQSGEAGSQ